MTEKKKFRVVGTLNCCRWEECDCCGSEYEKEYTEAVDTEVWAFSPEEAKRVIEDQHRDVDGLFLNWPDITDLGPKPVDQVMREIGAPMLPGLAEV